MNAISASVWGHPAGNASVASRLYVSVSSRRDAPAVSPVRVARRGEFRRTVKQHYRNTLDFQQGSGYSGAKGSRVLPLCGAPRFLAWLSFFSKRYSGVSSDPNVQYSILAGFATSETQTFWIQKAVDEIMVRHTGQADLELHASPIRSGRGIWRSFPCSWILRCPAPSRLPI